jgi:hypothetical protein
MIYKQPSSEQDDTRSGNYIWHAFHDNMSLSNDPHAVTIKRYSEHSLRLSAGGKLLVDRSGHGQY